MSFNEDGVEVLIPTIGPTGTKLTEAGAIALYKRTGDHLGKFTTPDAATAASKRISDSMELRLAEADTQRRLSRATAFQSSFYKTGMPLPLGLPPIDTRGTLEAPVPRPANERPRSVLAEPTQLDADPFAKFAIDSAFDYAERQAVRFQPLLQQIGVTSSDLNDLMRRAREQGVTPAQASRMSTAELKHRGLDLEVDQKRLLSTIGVDKWAYGGRAPVIDKSDRRHFLVYDILANDKVRSGYKVSAFIEELALRGGLPPLAPSKLTKPRFVGDLPLPRRDPRTGGLTTRMVTTLKVDRFGNPILVDTGPKFERPEPKPLPLEMRLAIIATGAREAASAGASAPPGGRVVAVRPQRLAGRPARPVRLSGRPFVSDPMDEARQRLARVMNDPIDVSPFDPFSPPPGRFVVIPAAGPARRSTSRATAFENHADLTTSPTSIAGMYYSSISSIGSMRTMYDSTYVPAPPRITAPTPAPRVSRPPSIGTPPSQYKPTVASRPDPPSTATVTAPKPAPKPAPAPAPKAIIKPSTSTAYRTIESYTRPAPVAAPQPAPAPVRPPTPAPARPVSAPSTAIIKPSLSNASRIIESYTHPKPTTVAPPPPPAPVPQPTVKRIPVQPVAAPQPTIIPPTPASRQQMEAARAAAAARAPIVKQPIVAKPAPRPAPAPSSSSSSSSGGETVRLASGSTATSGSTFSPGNGYTYRVNSDGSTTNLQTGRTYGGSSSSSSSGSGVAQSLV
jgi:hypothetical protein